MSAPPHHRRDRVARAIKQHLAESLLTKVKDPRVGLASVTRVEVTADLSHATAFVTVLGSEEERGDVLMGLQSARGYLRTLIASRLQLKTTPELHFEYDHGVDHANRMFELLDKLQEESTD